MTPASSPPVLPTRLRRLVETPSLLTPLRLWRSLNADERAAVARAFLADDSANRTRLVGLVAAARNFRPATVAKWPDDKVADAMKYAPVANARHATLLLWVLPQVPDRRVVASRFAGLLGLADPEDVFDHEAGNVSREMARQAADKLLDEFGARATFVYLLAMAQRKVPTARALQEWMRDKVSGKPTPEDDLSAEPAAESSVRRKPLAAEASPAPEERDALRDPAAPRRETDTDPAAELTDAAAAAPGLAADAAKPDDLAADAAKLDDLTDAAAKLDADDADEEDELAAEAADEPGREHTFTTLDRLLVQAAVDAKHGIEGALSEDEVDDAVDDYVHLSGRRQRSHFHAGFRDALFGRLPANAPLSNQRRAQWYWAGAVRGWARLELWPRIVAAYDDEELVRSLGNGYAASIAAVGDLVRALREEDRVDELATFVQTRALTAVPSPELFDSLLDAATDLLRQGEAARALAILDLLEKVSRSTGSGGHVAYDQLILDAKRRRAHCLRQLDQHDKASRILLNLLKRGPDASIRAMLHADLGMIKGGFRDLDDVRLPQRTESLERVRQQLAAGRRHFAKAVENDVRYASHGHFCLGVLALCEAEYGPATTHLDQAHAVIGADDGHYGEELRARIALYSGVATVLRLREEDLSRGARRIVQGLEGGAAFPPYWVRDVMTGLELGPKTALPEVARLVEEKSDEDAFDALAASPAVDHCGWLAPKLHKRAGRRGRKKSEVVEDLYAALRGYRGACRRGQDTSESAFEALDMLEGFAMQGIKTARFMEMLSRDDYDCPPLDVDDARAAHARCLEAQGETEQAAGVLGPMFQRLTTERDFVEAAGVLQKIRELGAPHEHLERRLSALSEPTADGEGTQAQPDHDGERPVTVLVVGGDERHAKGEERVRQEVAREDPAVEVRFVRSGWSPNWQAHMSQVRSRLEECDATVVMRFMRTQFGRRVRDECGKASLPWRFCWGAGPTAQARAVLEAARAARSAAPRGDDQP